MNGTKNLSSTDLDALKVRLYKMELGIGVFILLLLNIQTALTGPLNPEERFLFPISLGFCLGSFVLFQIFGRRYLPIFGKVVYALISLYFLAHYLAGLVTARRTQTPIDFDRFLIWIPVIYAIAFLSFSRRKALLASGGFVAALALEAVHHLLVIRGRPSFPLDFSMLLSIVSAGLVFTVIFYSLATVKEKYTETALLARALSLRADFDHLTQIYSRQKIFEFLDRYLDLAASQQRPFSILVLDMDDLKKINDAHGHLAGDEGLSYVAKTIRQCLRHTDAVGRIGGDEFLVICPDTTQREVQDLARRLVERVAAAPTPYGMVTVSCGTATWQAGDTPESLFHRADEAMYHNKRSKKNPDRRV